MCSIKVQCDICQHEIRHVSRIDFNSSLPGQDGRNLADERQAIIWTNTDVIHWRIYAAIDRRGGGGGGGDLIMRYLNQHEVYGIYKYIQLYVEDPHQALALGLVQTICAVEIIAWMGNHISQSRMYLMMYPCLNRKRTFLIKQDRADML